MSASPDPATTGSTAAPTILRAAAKPFLPRADAPAFVPRAAPAAQNPIDSPALSATAGPATSAFGDSTSTAGSAALPPGVNAVTGLPSADFAVPPAWLALPDGTTASVVELGLPTDAFLAAQPGVLETAAHGYQMQFGAAFRRALTDQKLNKLKGTAAAAASPSAAASSADQPQAPSDGAQSDAAPAALPELTPAEAKQADMAAQSAAQTFYMMTSYALMSALGGGPPPAFDATAVATATTGADATSSSTAGAGAIGGGPAVQAGGIRYVTGSDGAVRAVRDGDDGAAQRHDASALSADDAVGHSEDDEAETTEDAAAVLEAQMQQRQRELTASYMAFQMAEAERQEERRRTRELRAAGATGDLIAAANQRVANRIDGHLLNPVGFQLAFEQAVAAPVPKIEIGYAAAAAAKSSASKARADEKKKQKLEEAKQPERFPELGSVAAAGSGGAKTTPAGASAAAGKTSGGSSWAAVASSSSPAVASPPAPVIPGAVVKASAKAVKAAAKKEAAAAAASSASAATTAVSSPAAATSSTPSTATSTAATTGSASGAAAPTTVAAGSPSAPPTATAPVADAAAAEQQRRHQARADALLDYATAMGYENKSPFFNGSADAATGPTRSGAATKQGGATGDGATDASSRFSSAASTSAAGGDAPLPASSAFLVPLQQRTRTHLPHLRIDQRPGRKGAPASAAVAQFSIVPIVPSTAAATSAPANFEALPPTELTEFLYDLSLALRVAPFMPTAAAAAATVSSAAPFSSPADAGSVQSLAVSFGSQWKTLPTPQLLMTCKDHSAAVRALCPSVVPNGRAEAIQADDVTKDISGIILAVGELEPLRRMPFAEACRRRLNLQPLFDVLASVFGAALGNFQLQIRDPYGVAAAAAVGGMSGGSGGVGGAPRSAATCPSTYLLRTCTSEVQAARLAKPHTEGRVWLWLSEEPSVQDQQHMILQHRSAAPLTPEGAIDFDTLPDAQSTFQNAPYASPFVVALAAGTSAAVVAATEAETRAVAQKEAQQPGTSSIGTAAAVTATSPAATTVASAGAVKGKGTTTVAESSSSSDGSDSDDDRRSSSSSGSSRRSASNSSSSASGKPQRRSAVAPTSSQRRGTGDGRKKGQAGGTSGGGRYSNRRTLMNLVFVSVVASATIVAVAKILRS